ncbi:MAG: MAPEG family protein [Pseudomonadota bacterium]
MELTVTSVLTGAMAIMLALLSFPIADHRRKNRISAGDGGDEAFNRLIRAQANFTEYVPISLLLVALVELCGFQAPVVWGLAGTLAVSRLVHALGLIRNIVWARALGMILTLLVLVVGGGMLIVGKLL